MSLPSLSAEIYGHGKTIQISPRPGRFAPIGSAFPTMGETVEDTRKNIEYARQETKRWLASIAYLDDEAIRARDIHDGYFCRMETYDFVLECLAANAKLEDLETINVTLKAFLQPLSGCVGFVVRDIYDHYDILRYCYEALSGICYTLVALDASQGVDPAKLQLVESSIDSAKVFIMEHNLRIQREQGSWRIRHRISWLRKCLRSDPKGTLKGAAQTILSPVTVAVRLMRKDHAHLDAVPEHLRMSADR